MKQYLVTWEIDIYADSPEEAAKEAFEIMQDKDNSATAFTVMEHSTNETTIVDINET